MQTLALLLVAVLQAAPGDTLFVQASSLNLRSEPKASASVNMQVPIGAACTVKSLKPDGWAELSCGGTPGFGKLELLDAQAPNAQRLLAQGQEPGRPLPEAINLLQRALTLAPTDATINQAFRDLYWKAEFDRLTRARATHNTRKTPQTVSWPSGCGAPEACVKAALKPGEPITWEELHLQGTDMVLAQVFPNGLYQLRSGEFDAGKRTVTVQLESSTRPGPAVLSALGLKQDIPDVCQPTVSGEEGSTCGYTFDQICAPDNCSDPQDQCKRAASDHCGECKGQCASTCGSCRQQCGDRDRPGCVARCVETTRACEAKCQAPADVTFASCDATYKTCAAAEEKEWASKCETPCKRMAPCVEDCDKRHNNQRDGDASACITQCARKVKLARSCEDRCFFQYQ